MEDVAPPPQEAVEILEDHGGPGALMVLDRGDHDDPGHSGEGPGHDRPVLDEPAAGEAEGSKQGGPGRDDPGAAGPGRRGQPGDLEATVGIVDGVVRHQHLGRPGLETEAGHRREQLRVGGGPQGGRGGEGGVDLDEHPVALPDEGLHPSQGLNPLLEHGRPVRAPDDGHVRLVRGPAAGGKIPQAGQGLLSLGGGRALRSHTGPGPNRPRPGSGPRRTPTA